MRFGCPQLSDRGFVKRRGRTVTLRRRLVCVALVLADRDGCLLVCGGRAEVSALRLDVSVQCGPGCLHGPLDGLFGSTSR
jgi:hypothetical protein